MERQMFCEKCRHNFPTTELKYDRTGTHLLCKVCRKEVPKPDKNRFSKLIKSDVEDRKAKIKSKYICRKCEKNFELKPNFRQMCPHCGSAQIINNDYLKDAESLIEEAKDKKYEF